MSGMVDPLNHVEKDEMEEEGLGSPNASDDRAHEASICEADQASTVLKWSSEKVKSWLQQNVSFDHDRMQGYASLLFSAIFCTVLEAVEKLFWKLHNNLQFHRLIKHEQFSSRERLN